MSLMQKERTALPRPQKQRKKETLIFLRKWGSEKKSGKGGKADRIPSSKEGASWFSDREGRGMVFPRSMPAAV